MAGDTICVKIDDDISEEGTDCYLRSISIFDGEVGTAENTHQIEGFGDSIFVPFGFVKQETSNLSAEIYDLSGDDVVQIEALEPKSDGVLVTTLDQRKRRRLEA